MSRWTTLDNCRYCHHPRRAHYTVHRGGWGNRGPFLKCPGHLDMWLFAHPRVTIALHGSLYAAIIATCVIVFAVSIAHH